MPTTEQGQRRKGFCCREHVILALNEVDEAHDEAAFETGEREELFDYIDQSLTGHGVDVVGLTARHGLGPVPAHRQVAQVVRLLTEAAR
ncbi:hypothetical protein ABZ467_27965 [Streptomyces sp. NPDC005727]|uniref:hypothetical protein n=1 Tax=unclassified Streptomyces TaxID=2593676 RepID=UPI0033C7B9D4